MKYTTKRETMARGIIKITLGGVAVIGRLLLARKNRKAKESVAVELQQLVAVQKCLDNHAVSRYEAAQAARIVELEMGVKLRDANMYTNRKNPEMYQYVDGRLRAVEVRFANRR